MKTLNLNQPFSRLPISQRVEMIASMLKKAILKFCINNKVFKFKNVFAFKKGLSQICNRSAFKHILDLTSCAGADWAEQNKFLETLPNFSNLAFLIVLKTSKMVLKWQNCPAAWDFAPRPPSW